MALRKIIEIEGKSIIQTPIGVFETGTQTISFLAYIKVINVNGDKNQIAANVNFKGKDKESYKMYQVPVNNGDNYIAQTYRYLKTLPEFEGAEDC
jgi:hypothetical protein